MNPRLPWLLGFLALAVIASGLGVVYAKYLSRKNFVELQTIRSERDRAEVRWDRLQLEESTLATYSRVAADARKQLDMRIPEPAEVTVLR